MNLLNQAEQEFIQKHDHVQTAIGVVVKMSFSEPLPPGWRRVTIEQGYEIKDALNTIMNEWSIVAFQTGKLDGPGYGSKIMQSYGNECGEGFVTPIK